MDASTKQSLLDEAQEIRSFACRAMRLGEHLDDEADRQRLARYAADLEEYALQLEKQARAASMVDGMPDTE